MPSRWYVDGVAEVGADDADRVVGPYSEMPDKGAGHYRPAVLLRLDRKALGATRVGELTVFGLSSYISCSLRYYISPQLLTVISGILSALAGIVWFVREKRTGPAA